MKDRDLIAMNVLPAIMRNFRDNDFTGSYEDGCSELAYCMADAMIRHGSQNQEITFVTGKSAYIIKEMQDENDELKRQNLELHNVLGNKLKEAYEAIRQKELEVIKLKELFQQADDFLEKNKNIPIETGSILHGLFKSAAK